MFWWPPGPTGPTGPIGLTGVTGPTGAAPSLQSIIFDGGVASTDYTNGAGFDCGGLN